MDDVAMSTAYPIELEKSPEQKVIETEQNKEDYSLAALHDHPGWKQIRDKMAADIERIRSLSELQMNKYSDKELGEVVRGEFRVASKLEEYVNSVDNAVKAVVISNAARE